MERKPFAVMLDDDRAVAEMYRIGLEVAGFRVAIAQDPPTFFTTIDDELPDIVVLDWQLVGITGAEVLEQLREHWRTARLPVLMLSNFSTEADGAVDRVFSYGALGWLTKSSTSPALLADRLWETLRWSKP